MLRKLLLSFVLFILCHPLKAQQSHIFGLFNFGQQTTTIDGNEDDSKLRLKFGVGYAKDLEPVPWAKLEIGGAFYGRKGGISGDTETRSYKILQVFSGAKFPWNNFSFDLGLYLNIGAGGVKSESETVGGNDSSYKDLNLNRSDLGFFWGVWWHFFPNWFTALRVNNDLTNKSQLENTSQDFNEYQIWAGYSF